MLGLVTSKRPRARDQGRAQAAHRGGGALHRHRPALPVAAVRLLLDARRATASRSTSSARSSRSSSRPRRRSGGRLMPAADAGVGARGARGSAAGRRALLRGAGRPVGRVTLPRVRSARGAGGLGARARLLADLRADAARAGARALMSPRARARHHLPRRGALRRRDRARADPEPATRRCCSASSSAAPARAARTSSCPRSCGGSSGRSSPRPRSSPSRSAGCGSTHVDLIYCVTLPAGARASTGAVERGRRACSRSGAARAWGVANWSADGPARSGRTRAPPRRHRPAVRGAAALQPRRSRLGRGPGDARRAARERRRASSPRRCSRAGR